jgi:hypothetical protein
VALFLFILLLNHNGGGLLGSRLFLSRSLSLSRNFSLWLGFSFSSRGLSFFRSFCLRGRSRNGSRSNRSGLDGNLLNFGPFLREFG